MQSINDGIVIGMIATICMDFWAIVVKHVFRLPTANWRSVGRWFGYMPRGVFLHGPVSDSAPIQNELAIGWIAHYLTGITYGLAYLAVVQIAFDSRPSLQSALMFGIGTLLFPWFVMQPAMGAGILGSQTPQPMVTRRVNLSMHLVFGVSLYLGWYVIQ